jgi:hypothetical protein
MNDLETLAFSINLNFNQSEIEKKINKKNKFEVFNLKDRK